MQKIRATLGRSILEPDRNFHPVGAVGWMRLAVKLRKGRKLRVVIYVRISTDEQRAQSLAAQISFCRQALLDMGLTLEQIEIRAIEDEGISGEIVSRPGIDEVNRLIREHRLDLLIVEDASRLYRIENPCFQLVENAIEHGARVICVRDRVDSAEEGVWGTRLHDAMQQHGRANEFTRYRINRTLEELWLSGAAVGKRKPGYVRHPSIPATVDTPARGPWFDEVDPSWIEVIIEAYRRASAGETPQTIANHLTKVGLPRQGRRLRTNWDDKAVLALFRDAVYRGHEEFRRTFSRRPWAGGKATVRQSEKDKVWHRDMPNLRIVTDYLWYSANDAIDQRSSTRNRSRGVDNPLYGVPRDSRSPIAGVLYCRCGAKMYNTGSGRYRCSRSLRSLPLTDQCWNAATANCELTHQAIAAAIRQYAEQFNSQFAAGLDAVRALLEDGANNESAAQQLVAEIEELKSAAANLIEIGERAKQPLETVAARLEVIQQSHYRKEAELAELQDHRVELELPTSTSLLTNLHQLCAELEQGDWQVNRRLRHIVPRIVAKPHQQFGCNLVVLQARFELNLFGLLPAAVRLAFQRNGDRFVVMLPVPFRPIAMEVELFERSIGPKHWSAVLAFEGQNLGLTEIGRRLGIKKHEVWVARTYGRKLRAAGLTDPYLELIEAPEAASRWRPNGSRGGKNV